MNNIGIVYQSVHHGNTKKLLEGLKELNEIDLLTVSEAKNADLSKYEVLGFASGIFAGKMHKGLYSVVNMDVELPKKAFVIFTSGINRPKYGMDLKDALESKGIEVLGVSGTRGYDTFSVLKLIGGIAKGRPNADDISQVDGFLKGILEAE